MWCRARAEQRLTVHDVFDAPPKDGGRILRPLWGKGVVLQHPAEMSRDEAWAAARAWAESLRGDEDAPKTLVLLRTEVERLSAEAVEERSVHAVAFGQAWLESIDATHGIRLRARPPAGGVLPVRTVSTSDAAELTLDPTEVAHVLQRLYGQHHPDRAASIGFCSDGNDDEDDDDEAALEAADGRMDPPLYLLGFAQPWTPDAPQDGSDAFDHAHRFACQWCATVQCEHNLYVDPFGADVDKPTIYVFRDDVTAELNFDEEEPAAAIARRYRARHPERTATFIGEYIK